MITLEQLRLLVNQIRNNNNLDNHHDSNGNAIMNHGQLEHLLKVYNSYISIHNDPQIYYVYSIVSYNIQEEWLNYISRKKISLLDYWPVLPIHLKYSFIQIERQVEMRHQLQDAFFRAIFDGFQNTQLVIQVRRERLLMDASKQLYNHNYCHHDHSREKRQKQRKWWEFKKQLRVIFMGEEAVDEGGVQREFFLLIMKEIFANSLLFKWNEEGNCYWFNSNENDRGEIGDNLMDKRENVATSAAIGKDSNSINNLINANNSSMNSMIENYDCQHDGFCRIKEMNLVGILLGLAIHNSILLDLKFPLIFYKKLLLDPNREEEMLELGDLQDLDPLLFQSLQSILQMKREEFETLNLTWEMIKKHKGGDKEIKTRENHSLLPIYNNENLKNHSNHNHDHSHNENIISHDYTFDSNDTDNLVLYAEREKFIKSYLKMILLDSCRKDFNILKDGFINVCGPESIIFKCHPKELQFLICGSEILDFEALKKGSIYEGGYTSDSPIIKWFWNILFTFTIEEKKSFLLFVSGSERAPLNGLQDLGLTIARNGIDADRLPTAHTCFNILLLNEYKSKEKLEYYLKLAIKNCQGFGLC